MKSRLAILGMLVAGMLFSTAGAGLAISGVTQSGDNAAISQYGAASPTPTATPVCTSTPMPNNNGGRNDNNGGTNDNAAPNDRCGEGGVLPAEETNAPSNDTAPASENGGGGGGVSPAEETQPSRQQAAAAQTSQLPFTGFAAIPVLLGGLALLSGGLVLRRRTNS